MELYHSGSTYKRDIGLRIDKERGLYFALGKLDGGLNFPFSQWAKWRFKKYQDSYSWRFGPFDLMWLKGAKDD